MFEGIRSEPPWRRLGKDNPQGVTWGLNGKKSSGKPEFIFLLLYYVKSNSVKRRLSDEKEVAG